ncbi:hypothetical protein AMTRI_Chr13g88640 [Amborella trichopoda]
METPPKETMLVEVFASISFAKAWGFSLRLQQTIVKEGDGNGTTRRYYVCHRDGHLTNKELCNCGAHMSIAKVMDSDISYWRVVTFEVRFLPAYHNISESYKHHIQQFSKNFVCATNNANRDNDAHILLTKCNQMKDRDKDFKYDFTVSVKNHGDTRLFGCTFVGLMNGKMPQTILTDQDLALKEKICKELPPTLSMHFFDTNFYKLYNLESIEDFEEGWHASINKFALHSNRHINNLSNLKEFWALPYLRSHFIGMKTTGCSESINASTFDATKVQQSLVLTPYAFSKIQEEIISSFQFLTSRNDDGTYEVTHSSKKEKGRKVSLTVKDNVMNCSCKGFEFTGIICRHSLHVLFKENFIQIPDRYLPKRWRRSTSLISNVSSSTSAAYVERVQTIQSLASTIGTKGARFDDCHKFIMEQFSRILEHVEEVECMRSPMDKNRLHCESIHVKNPIRSITKGQPPEKRLKPHIEVAKKPRYCKVPSCG